MRAGLDPLREIPHCVQHVGPLQMVVAHVKVMAAKDATTTNPRPPGLNVAGDVLPVVVPVETEETEDWEDYVGWMDIDDSEPIGDNAQEE